MNKQKPKLSFVFKIEHQELQCKFSTQEISELTKLLRTGFYGKNLAEVVERLVAQELIKRANRNDS